MGPEVSPLVTDPISLALCDATIGPNCENYWVHAGPGRLRGGAGGWLRQETNVYLDTPVDKAKDLDPKVRGILGYSLSGALGQYDYERANTPKPTKPPNGESKISRRRARLF